ncbi:MAG: hypothetical protein J6U93_07695, partial [Alistipes sp.]|nr:hypothetical protein [Alistipes sp.]
QGKYYSESPQQNTQEAEINKITKTKQTAEIAIAADKALVTQYNEYLHKNLYNELADIICRSGVIDYPNMVVDSAELITSEPRTVGVKRFDIVLHCITSTTNIETTGTAIVVPFPLREGDYRGWE